MSNIHYLDDQYAFPIESVEAIKLGPLHPEWQPSPAHLIAVEFVHSVASALVGGMVVVMIAAICFWMGA